MFRKIYWVVEKKLSGDQFQVHGVYTSIQDLIDSGVEEASDVRLTLVKLDAKDGVLGTWSAPKFEGIRESLEEYIGTGEFTIDQCDHLVATLIG